MAYFTAGMLSSPTMRTAAFGDALLLFAGEGHVSLFPGRVDLVTRGGSAVGKGQDGADRSYVEGGRELLGRSYEHLESHLFLARLQRADHFDRGR